MSTTIFIDVDIPYEEYKRDVAVTLLMRIEPYHGLPYAWIRRSASGNTHLKLIYLRSLSVFETFMIRAVMRDDAYRLRADLERYLTKSPIMGLIFSTKIDLETGEIKDAGEWIPL